MTKWTLCCARNCKCASASASLFWYLVHFQEERPVLLAVHRILCLVIAIRCMKQDATAASQHPASATLVCDVHVAVWSFPRSLPSLLQHAHMEGSVNAVASRFAQNIVD